jgi:hypothetical protein
MSIKLKLFMYGFRAYTYGLFQLRKLFNYAVNKTVSTIPDCMVWTLFPVNKQNRKNVKILMAKGFSQKSETSMDATNAVNLFLNLYWDNEACDDNGGIQIYKLKEVINHVDLLWICYLHSADHIENNIETFIPNLKYMFFDLKTDTIYKYDSYSIPGVIGIEPTEVIFDQVGFNPDFNWD